MAVQRVDSSGQGAVSVTPSDTVNITTKSGTKYTKGLYVGTSGDVKVVMADGGDALYKGLAAGVVHPLSVIRVYSTGTTATDILAVF